MQSATQCNRCNLFLCKHFPDIFNVEISLPSKIIQFRKDVRVYNVRQVAQLEYNILWQWSFITSCFYYPCRYLKITEQIVLHFILSTNLYQSLPNYDLGTGFSGVWFFLFCIIVKLKRFIVLFSLLIWICVPDPESDRQISFFMFLCKFKSKMCYIKLVRSRSGTYPRSRRLLRCDWNH